MKKIIFSFLKILPKCVKIAYLKNTINDVENRLAYAKHSVSYYECRLEELKQNLEKL
jgi:hypothetical protein